MNVQRNLILGLGILFFIFTVGVGGYQIIEHWSFFDALYMTVITLATIGYGEVHPLSTAGRIFTIFLILSGMGVLAYVATTGITFLVEGQLGGLLKKRKMEKRITALEGHYVICAAGEMGMYVIEEFHKTKQKFVVASHDKHVILPWVKTRADILYIEGDPSSDDVLAAAGVGKAAGLVSALGEDKLNLFVVLSARQLNPNIRIISQAISRTDIPKLKKAGADDVVSAMEIGGMRIASTMIRPAVVSFLDQMLYAEDRVLRVEEKTVSGTSPLVNKTLDECSIPCKTGLMVIAIKDSGTGKYAFNPQGAYKLKDGDILVVIGGREELELLDKLMKNV